MALFKKDKTEEKSAEKTETKAADVSSESKDTAVKGKETKGKEGIGAGDLYWVLKKPHLTEKSTDLSMHNAYVFDVDPQANKKQIMEAVRVVYDVTPTKVRTMNEPNKKIRTRKGMGVRTRGKKAIVFLKEGDKIEFI